jgi:ATP-binding cassette subfamily B protein
MTAARSLETWERRSGATGVPRRPRAAAFAATLRALPSRISRGPGIAGFPRRPIAFLWHYVRRRPFLHFFAIVSVVGAASFACFSQYGLKLIVDAMAGGPQQLARVWTALAVYAGLLAGEAALWRFGARFGYRAILADKSAAQLDLFDHLSGHSSRYFADRMGGSLANRIVATGESMQQVFTSVLFTMAPVCADFLAALVMLATVGWRLVAALGAFVVLSAGLLAVFSHRGGARHRDYADRAAEVGGELVDILSNIWVVKAFSAQARERRRFERLLGNAEGAHRDSLGYVERLRVTHDIGLWLMGAGLLAWTLSMWSRGEVSAGDVILTVALAFRILHGSRDLAFALVNTTQFIARIAESIQVIGEDHKVVDHPEAQDLVPLGGSIAFEKVDFAYPDGNGVFRGLDLRIEPGQRVGLVGPSGAGKSTLIALVQRLYDVDGGRLSIDGQDIRSMTQDSLRAAIAVVPQDISLFHRSVLENIRYARPDASDEEVLAAAQAARCDGFVDALPQGYGTIVGERGVKLSGGQRQRLGIARALLKDAPIIILDEATASLDSGSEIEIQRALDALMRGRTVLAIAHRLSTVKGFDRIVVLDHGQIAEDGAPEELRRRRGLFDRMCRLQESGGTDAAGPAWQPGSAAEALGLV